MKISNERQLLAETDHFQIFASTEKPDGAIPMRVYLQPKLESDWEEECLKPACESYGFLSLGTEPEKLLGQPSLDLVLWRLCLEFDLNEANVSICSLLDELRWSYPDFLRECEPTAPKE